MWSDTRTFVLLLVATTVASFVGVSWVLNRHDVRSARVDTPQDTILTLASQLTSCLSRESTSATSKDRCVATAASLSTSLRSLSPADQGRFDLFQKSSFDVIRQRDHVILFKEACGPADLSVKTFAWALFPTDPATLPTERRALGYFNVAVDYDAIGFSVAGACVLATKLPVTAIKSFSIGQVRLPDSHWLWRVDS